MYDGGWDVDAGREHFQVKIQPFDLTPGSVKIISSWIISRWSLLTCRLFANVNILKQLFFETLLKA